MEDAKLEIGSIRRRRSPNAYIDFSTGDEIEPIADPRFTMGRTELAFLEAGSTKFHGGKPLFLDEYPDIVKFAISPKGFSPLEQSRLHYLSLRAGIQIPGGFDSDDWLQRRIETEEVKGLRDEIRAGVHAHGPVRAVISLHYPHPDTDSFAHHPLLYSSGSFVKIGVSHGSTPSNALLIEQFQGARGKDVDMHSFLKGDQLLLHAMEQLVLTINRGIENFKIKFADIPCPASSILYVAELPAYSAGHIVGGGSMLKLTQGEHDKGTRLFREGKSLEALVTLDRGSLLKRHDNLARKKGYTLTPVDLGSRIPDDPSTIQGFNVFIKPIKDITPDFELIPIAEEKKKNKK